MEFITPIYYISLRRQPTRGGPTDWGFDEGLTTPHRKKSVCYEMLNRASVVGTCEHGNEPFGSAKGGEFLD